MALKCKVFKNKNEDVEKTINEWLRNKSILIISANSYLDKKNQSTTVIIYNEKSGGYYGHNKHDSY